MTEKKLVRRKVALWVLSGVIIVLGLFIYFRFYFVYSEGSRVGILYKFSKKGTVFKTYEGEIILPGLRFKQAGDGISSNIFSFSVDDEELAKQLMSCQGMEVEVHYVQYNGVLPWRGDGYEKQDGQYIVDQLIQIKDESPNGYGL